MRRGLAQVIEKFRQINRRYRTPRLAMSGGVRQALLALRIYLLVLVALMLYKFITLVQG